MIINGWSIIFIEWPKEQRTNIMAELSGYRDLTQAPLIDEPAGEDAVEQSSVVPVHSSSTNGTSKDLFVTNYNQSHLDAEAEFSNNVRTLIRLVGDLPEGVTKQTGAQIIRLTMEAMGISMEDVLTEAQTAQSEMLDAVRGNIKKIEEYKTVIRKLESDIKYYQGKANELSEIIDLFILSNTSPKVPSVDDLLSSDS